MEKDINVLDLIVLVIKKKHILLPVTLLFMIAFYLTIFFGVEEKFDSSSLIIPNDDNSTAGIAGLLGDIGNLPFNIGGGIVTTEMSMYNTIIYSRTSLEKVIKKFNLVDVYELDTNDIKYKKKILERISDEITTEETENGAYTITVRATSPELAASINNYIVSLLNESIKKLKVKKSRDNRIFLESRVSEVKSLLKKSEDSLVIYQQKSKLLEVDGQIQEIIQNYSQMEFDLVQKKIEESVYKSILGKKSPQLTQTEQFVKEYERKIDELKNEGIKNSLILPIKNLPEAAIKFLRFKREVEINAAILQFILPLFEQAKLEEKKDLPILQIIDNAVPPVEKSYPPRAIFTVLFGIGIFFILLSYFIFAENENLKKSDKVAFIKRNIFKFSSNLH